MKFIRIAAALAATAAAGLVAPAVASATTAVPSSTVVISAFYGGGGNAPDAYARDFVELFNAGSVPQSLSGWSVQMVNYAIANGGALNFVEPLPAVTLQPGQSFLFVGLGNSSTTAVPALPGQEPLVADLNDNSTNNINAANNTVYLARNTTPLYASTSTPVGTDDTSPAIVDEVGDGTAAFHNGPAMPALSGTTVGLRLDNGCTNTDDNAADFQVFTPTAANPFPFRTMSSALEPCSTPVPALPESPLTVGLPIGGAAILLAGGYIVSRRRRDAD